MPLMLHIYTSWCYGNSMELYEKGDPQKHDHAPELAQAVENARVLTAQLIGVSPNTITQEDIVNAFRAGGFAVWPADIAARLTELPGFEHI